MNRKTLLASTFAVSLATSALATPSTPQPTTAQAHASSEAKQTAHASLRLDVAHAKAWVGQAVRVTLHAYFRGAEGVTLEGAPQLTSTGIFTSDLSREPAQSTEIIGGEPVLVATWTGTVTPSSPAALTLAAELPVRVRYRDPAPRVEPREAPDDPFADLRNNPFDTSVFDRFFSQSMDQPLGRLHDETVSLRTSTQSIDVRALPTAGQPPSFSGAIGHFDVSASVSSARGRVSEPISLRVTVEGDGDLDRVDLAGVPSSDAWKAYPPKSTIEPATKGTRRRKTFEQVLVPLRGGEVVVPAMTFTAFDPDSSRYVTRETAPLTISVAGTASDYAAAPAQSEATVVAPAPSPSSPGPFDAVRPPVMPETVRPARVALWLAPALMLAALVALASRVRRMRRERALRRAMRRAAVKGEARSFYRAAHALIEKRLSERWGVPPEDVSILEIRARLGEGGDSLTQVISADEALRFGRGRLEHTNLVPLCASIEQSLGGAR